MNSEKVPLNLYKKIHSIIKDGVFAEKDGRNLHQKYNYASEASILKSIKPKLIEYGLVVTFSESDCILLFDKVVKVTYNVKMLDIDSGEYEIFKISGLGYDTTDKGVPKAFTAAQKYFFAKTFAIATGDDPENDEHKVEKTNESVIKATIEKPKMSMPNNTASKQVKTPPADAPKHENLAKPAFAMPKGKTKSSKAPDFGITKLDPAALPEPTAQQPDIEF